MANRSPAIPEWLTVLPRAKYVFYGLILSLLVIAIGHLYVLEGVTELYLGLPLWIWVQLVVVFAMVGIAWIAIQLVAAVRREGR